MATHEQSQDSQSHMGIASGGDSRDVARAAQPRGGHCDNSQGGGYRCKCKPSQLDGVHQEDPLSTYTGYFISNLPKGAP